MRTFAQALARIELLLKQREASSRRQDTLSWKVESDEIQQVLADHADSIVQLGKVAGEMRSSLGVHEGLAYRTHNELLVGSIQSYDALMNKGGE